MAIHRALQFAKGAVAIFIILALVHFHVIDMEALLHLFKDPIKVICVIVILVLGVAVASKRWQILLMAQGLQFNYKPTFFLFGFSSLAGTVLPGGASGEALKILWIVRSTNKARMPAVISIVMDKMIALFSIMFIGAVAAIININQVMANKVLMTFSMSLWILTGGATIIVLILVSFRRWWGIGQPLCGNSRVIRYLNQGMQVLYAYIDAPIVIVKAFALSIICSLIMLLSIELLSYSVEGADMAPSQYAIGMVAGLIANLLPFTPGGIGVGESGFGYVCRLFDTDSVVAYGSVFLAFRLASILALLPFMLTTSHIKFILNTETNALNGTVNLAGQ